MKPIQKLGLYLDLSVKTSEQLLNVMNISNQWILIHKLRLVECAGIYLCYPGKSI